MDKKKQQLGMNPSTARSRLMRDIVWRFLLEQQIVCHRCGQLLTQDDWTIDHIDPWLDSDDPVGNYFDQDNIAFSHASCNTGARRIPWQKYETKEERLTEYAKRKREKYDPQKRRHKYLIKGH